MLYQRKAILIKIALLIVIFVCIGCADTAEAFNLPKELGLTKEQKIEINNAVASVVSLSAEKKEEIRLETMGKLAHLSKYAEGTFPEETPQSVQDGISAAQSWVENKMMRISVSGDISGTVKNIQKKSFRELNETGMPVQFAPPSFIVPLPGE